MIAISIIKLNILKSKLVPPNYTQISSVHTVKFVHIIHSLFDLLNIANLTHTSFDR